MNDRGAGYTPSTGPIADAANSIAGVTRVGNSYSGTGPAPASTPADGMTDAQRMNAPFAAQLSALDTQQRANAAADATSQQAQFNAQQQQMRKQDASYQRDQILGGTELFHAQNAHDYRMMGALLGRVAGYNNTLAEAPQGQQDYLGDVAKTQGIISQAAASRISQQQGEQGLQKGGQELQQGQFALQHADLLRGIAQRMQNETPGSPEHRQLMNTFRVLQGKDPLGPKVNVLSGATTTNPDNPLGSPLNTGASLSVTDPYTGETHVIPAAGGQRLMPAAPPSADNIAALKANPHLAQIFDAQFGPGASKQYLGSSSIIGDLVKRLRQ